MTEPNFIILIDLDSGKTALQKRILKITKNNGLKSKKTSLEKRNKNRLLTEEYSFWQKIFIF